MKPQNIALFTTILLLGAAASEAQLANTIYVSDSNGVSTYNATTGAMINASFITTSGFPYGAMALSGNTIYVDYGHNNTLSAYNATTGVALSGFTPITTTLKGTPGLLVSGNDLFVSDLLNNRIGEYNATTGAVINANFISISRPDEMAISGNNFFVVSGGGVAEFNATTGAVINPSFIATSGSAFGLAISGNNLYVSEVFNADSSDGTTVGEYDATTGATINSSFISNLDQPGGLAVDGNTLYVANSGAGNVPAYDATTGAPLAGYTAPSPAGGSTWVTAVPEPGCASLAMISGLGLLLRRRRNGEAA